VEERRVGVSKIGARAAIIRRSFLVLDPHVSSPRLGFVLVAPRKEPPLGEQRARTESARDNCANVSSGIGTDRSIGMLQNVGTRLDL